MPFLCCLLNMGQFIARDFKKKGAVYCYIQKMYTDGSGTAGALEYIFNQEEEE